MFYILHVLWIYGTYIKYQYKNFVENPPWKNLLRNIKYTRLDELKCISQKYGVNSWEHEFNEERGCEVKNKFN
jgi:hypothetical protein